MWREIKKKSTYQHGISSGSMVDKIQMQCHCCIFLLGKSKECRGHEATIRGGRKTVHIVFLYICPEACFRKGPGTGGITPSNLIPALFPG
jgi:hypothetical protein